MEPPSPPAWQGFRLHAVHGSCVAQLGFSKGVIKPRCSFLVTQTECGLKRCPELVRKFRPDPHLKTTAPACTSTALKPSPVLDTVVPRADASLWLLAGRGSRREGGCSGVSSAQGCGTLPLFSLPRASISLQALRRAIFPPRITGALPPSATRALLQPVPPRGVQQSQEAEKRTSCISQAFKGFTHEGGFSSLPWEPNKKRVHCEAFKGSRQDHSES